MEDDLDYGKDMTLEELEKLEEVDVEFDKDGRLLGIEVLNASKILNKELLVSVN